MIGPASSGLSVSVVPGVTTELSGARTTAHADPDINNTATAKIKKPIPFCNLVLIIFLPSFSLNLCV
jgi:hypothetical protein